MTEEELECVKDIMLSSMKTQDVWFDISDGFVETLKEKDKEIERLNNIINELEKWIDKYYKSNRKWFNTELSSHDKRYYEREYINTEAMLIKFDKQLKELKGVDKE